MAANQKYCPSCGTPSTIEAAFCLSCGSKFPSISVPGVPSAAAPVPATPPPMPTLPQTPRGDFITLSCPNCGGKLNITSDIERFACQFCGHEHIVRRNDGMISLEPIMRELNANINLVGVGVSKLGFSSEKQVAEQTITRLKGEIAEIDKVLASNMDGNQTAMILGIVMGMIGGGLIIGAIIGGWKFWVWLIALIILGFGIALVAATAKEPDSMKAIRQNLANKQAELQRNYDIVRRE